MEIDLDKLARIAEMFRNPDPVYAGVAEALHRERTKSPAERRADIEEMLSAAAQVEVAGGEFAEAAGRLRRSLAAELFCGRIAGGTPFAS